jgi:putative ABC transport system permease protein
MFKVAGILDPTGTPNDQGVFINLEGFFVMNKHTRTSVVEAVVDTRRGKQRISAVLVVLKNKDVVPEVWQNKMGETEVYIDPDLSSQDNTTFTLSFASRLVRDLDVQVASPTHEITRLFEMIVGRIQIVLVIFAVMVIIVAAIGMMVSIYNSMNERRQEIAIMRALGASRGTVMMIILLESILLSLGGGVIGVGIGHGLIAAVGPIIASAVMVVVNPWHFQASELILIPGLIVLASLVGYLPAVVAYRTDVAQSLNP